MSTNNISSNYYDGLNIYNKYIAEQNAKKSEDTKTNNADANKILADNNNSKTNEKETAKNSPYQNNINSLTSAVSDAMKDLNLGPNDKVTFNTILKHKALLESQFSEEVKAGLKKAGVSEDVEFRVVAGENGKGLKVITDSEDKAKIEKFFKDNPELIKKFEKIQGLESLENTRKTQQISPSAVRSRIQIESMSSWFSNADSQGLTNMAYLTGKTSFFTGINTTV